MPTESQNEREPLPAEVRQQAIAHLTALWNGEVDEVRFVQQGSQQKAYPATHERPTSAPRAGSR